MEHVTWPLAFLLLVVFVCIYFRKEISSLLSRTTAITRQGLRAEALQRTQRPEPSTLEQALDTTSLLLRQREETVRKFLDDSHLNNSADQIRLLIRHVALLQIILDFESIQSSIFGSQVTVLNAANSQPAGYSIAAVRNVYDAAAKDWEMTYRTYSFDLWLAYLTRNELVEVRGDLLFITQKGREFLAFLVHTGRNYL